MWRMMMLFAMIGVMAMLRVGYRIYVWITTLLSRGGPMQAASAGLSPGPVMRTRTVATMSMSTWTSGAQGRFGPTRSMDQGVFIDGMQSNDDVER